jgi:hypothetical protein
MYSQHKKQTVVAHTEPNYSKQGNHPLHIKGINYIAFIQDIVPPYKNKIKVNTSTNSTAPSLRHTK